MLATAQANLVADGIRAVDDDVTVELVPIVTCGDRTKGRLEDAGGKGLFTGDLEAALRSGAIDLAVHSAKDLPAAMPPDLTIAAVPPRCDPRDALISPGGGAVEDLPPQATVGTSSPRRRAQLLAIRPDLEAAAIRGNIETRIARLLAPGHGRPRLDAIVLAMAGLVRSGLLSEYRAHIRPLDIERFVPAGGQGALVVQAADASGAAALANTLNDPPSAQALEGERSVLRALAADCRTCIAVHLAESAARWTAWLMAGGQDGRKVMRLKVVGGSAEEASTLLIEQSRSHGVRELLGN